MARRRKIFPTSIIIQMIIAPVVIIGCVIFFVFGVNSTVKTGAVYDVVAGDSLTSVANRLVADKLIDSEKIFKMAIRLQGGKIQRGQYDIPVGASIWRIADMFATGQVASTTIVIPEGCVSIGKLAFKLCKKLEEITIPTTVTKFGDLFLEECMNLKKTNH